MGIRNRTWTDKQFIKAVKESKSIAETLRKIGLTPFGANYKIFKKTTERLKIDTSHFLGQSWLRDNSHNFSKKIPLEEILIENSTYTNTNSLRKRLINEEILENKCKFCGLLEWLGKHITLHLDHINGINDDNRLENLRLLCPNCHSQTESYCGKNKKITRLTKKEIPKCDDCQKEVLYTSKRCKACFTIWQKGKVFPKQEKFCLDCGTEVYLNSKRCKSCAGKHHQIKKINWPPIEELIKMVKETSYSAAGRQLGVSDNAIRKHIKRYKKE